MKALVVLSAIIAVVLSVPVDQKYIRSGAYVPWQPPRYYNSYNQVKNVYSSPRWYQSTIRPVKYEASSLSPWLSQGKAKFSFGSALTPAVTAEPETEQIKTIVETAQAVPKKPAGFGAFHFGKKSTPSIVVAKEEIKPIEITKTIVVSSNNAEASLKSISEKESAQVSVSEQIKPIVVEAVSIQNPEIKPIEDSKKSEFIITTEIKSEEKKLDVEASNEKVNQTSVAIEKANIELAETKPSLVEEKKPLSIVENQSISEIKSDVIAPVVIKKKHGFSFSSSNVYNRNPLPLYSQVQPSAAVSPEIKPIVIQAIQPAIQLKPTLQPAIVETNKATIAPASSTIETVQATTTENVPSTNKYVVSELDISQGIVQISVPSEVYAVNPSTADYVVPTVDISQPIIQYASLSNDYASTTFEPSQTTTESSSATLDYASEYSPINSESIDALLSAPDATTEISQAEINQESYGYSTTESEASTTENTPITTESTSNEYLQNDIESAVTTVQSEPLKIESVPAIESSGHWVSGPLIISAQSESHSSTPSIGKKKLGFSFSYNPSGYVYKKEALAYKPYSEISAPEIKTAPAVTTQAPTTVQYLQPVVSTVVPAANIWSNSYNEKKNSFSFSYKPSFSYFNKQPLYQPQVAINAPSAAITWSVPSASPIVSSPAIQSSSSYVEIAPASVETAPAAPEYVESTTILLENSPEDAQSITTESSLSESTTLSIEYGTTESVEKGSIERELAPSTAESNIELGTQSAVVESSNVAANTAPAFAGYFSAPSIAPQVLPASNTWSNSDNTKKNAYSFSYFPSFGFFNKPSFQPQITVIAPVSASIPTTSSAKPLHESSAAAIESSSSSLELSPISTESAPLLPEIAESTTTLNEIATDNAEIQYSTTESYSDETTTLAIESNEYLSTTQSAVASSQSLLGAIESSIKEALKGQLANLLISKDTAPVVAGINSENVAQSSSGIKPSPLPLESASVSAVSSPVIIDSAPAAVASVQAIPQLKEVVAQSSSGIKPSPLPLESASVSAVSSPVIIDSAPAAVASVQAIPQPLYVKEVTKVNPPVAFPAVQSFVTKKHGFSFSYKPSGNFYNKPEVTATVAPAIVESSPVIVSAAPAIVESGSVIASVAPTLAPSEEAATHPSLFLTLFNAVKSAILDGETTDLAEVKPEVHLIQPVVAEPTKHNSELNLLSQFDIVAKASPISPEIKKDADIIHDLRTGI